MNSTHNWRNILYLALLSAAVILVATWWSELTRLWSEHLATFIFVTIMMALGIVIQSRNFLTFLLAKNNIRAWPLTRVWAVSALANYLGPFQPGIALRIIYLKNNEVSLASSLLATARQSLISIWISFAGLALGAWLHGDPKMSYLAITCGVAFLFTPLLRNFIVRFFNRISRPKLLIQRRELLVNAISNTTGHGALGVIAQYFMGTALLFIAYDRFGADIDFGYALLMTCAVYITSLVTLVPGNFGITEAIYIIGGHQLGMSAGDAVALAFLFRGAHICSCFLILTLTHKFKE